MRSSASRRLPWARLWQVPALLSVLLLVYHAAPVHADTIEHTEDEIIFARADSLWTIPASGGTPTPLLKLPWPAKDLGLLQVSSDGTALLVGGKGFTAWTAIQRGSGQARLGLLPCSGPSHISADGNQVVCGTQDSQRIAIYTLRPTLSVQIIDRKALGPLYFGASKSEIICFGDNDDLIALSKDGERVVATHRPESSMAVSPDGKRAIGDYNEGAIHVVYAFRLDGKASKRTLVHAARSLDVSADSAWVAVQQEVDACAVRIVGGQYMCWRRYQALAISSRGHSLLISRANSTGHDLYLGAVRGTSSRKPTPLIKAVARVATFWPSPQSTTDSPTGPTAEDQTSTPAAENSPPTE